MHDKHCRILEQNATLLNNDLEINMDFLSVFLKDRILTQTMITSIMKDTKSTERCFEFLRLIRRRPPKAFDRLIQALVMTSHEHIARELDPQLTEHWIKLRELEDQKDSAAASSEEGGAVAKLPPSDCPDYVGHVTTGEDPMASGTVGKGVAKQSLENEEKVKGLSTAFSKLMIKEERSEELSSRILRIIRQRGPIELSELCRELGGLSKKSLNPELYRLRDCGHLVRHQESPPIWRLPSLSPSSHLKPTAVELPQTTKTTQNQGQSTASGKMTIKEESSAELTSQILRIIGQKGRMPLSELRRKLDIPNKKSLNPDLYRMESSGQLVRYQESPPIWGLPLLSPSSLPKPTVAELTQTTNATHNQAMGVRPSSSGNELLNLKATPSSDKGVRQIPDEGEEHIDMEILNVEKEAAQKILENTKDVYPMKSKPRGRAVILSNETFSGGLLCRYSGLFDRHHLKLLFKGLGFEPVVWKDKTYAEIWEHIEEERLHKAHKDADAFIFAILSHGNRGNIFSTDGKEVCLEKIYAHFDGRMCPFLKGKPKIFFIEACQKDSSSGGTPQGTVTGSAGAGGSNNDIPEPQPPTASDEPVIHDKADCIFVRATVAGQEAKRGGRLGSWFVRDLVHTFLEECHVNHLMDMLNEVNRKLEQRDDFMLPRVSHQVLDVQSTGLKRHIYFLPGYFESDTSILD